MVNLNLRQKKKKLSGAGLSYWSCCRKLKTSWGSWAMWCNFLSLFYSRCWHLLPICVDLSPDQSFSTDAPGNQGWPRTSVAGRTPPSTVSELFRNVNRPSLTKATSLHHQSSVPSFKVLANGPLPSFSRLTRIRTEFWLPINRQSLRHCQLLVRLSRARRISPRTHASHGPLSNATTVFRLLPLKSKLL